MEGGVVTLSPKGSCSRALWYSGPRSLPGKFCTRRRQQRVTTPVERAARGCIASGEEAHLARRGDRGLGFRGKGGGWQGGMWASNGMQRGGMGNVPRTRRP